MSQANPDYVPQNIQSPLVWHYATGKAADESDTTASFPGLLDVNDILGSNGTYVPPAGMVGEIVYAARVPGQALNMPSGITTNLLSVTLSPGDWDAWAQLCIERRNLPTSTDYWMASLTPLSQIMYPDQTSVSASGGNTIPLNGIPLIATLGPSIITTSIPLTLNLNASCGFVNGGGTAVGFGNIYARRRR